MYRRFLQRDFLRTLNFMREVCHPAKSLSCEIEDIFVGLCDLWTYITGSSMRFQSTWLTCEIGTEEDELYKKLNRYVMTSYDFELE